MVEDTFCWHILSKFLFFFQNRKFGEYLCKMPPKKRSKKRGSHEGERMSTRARSPEVEELSCVPDTQQSQQTAGVEELVVGVEDPVVMSDTKQGDIGLETKQDSDSSDEDTQDTSAAGGTQKGKGKARLTKGARNPLFCSVLRRSRSLRDNEILYKDYKDRFKREAVWDKFCGACQRWFQSQRTLFGKVIT